MASLFYHLLPYEILPLTSSMVKLASILNLNAAVQIHARVYSGLRLAFPALLCSQTVGTKAGQDGHCFFDISSKSIYNRCHGKNARAAGR